MAGGIALLLFMVLFSVGLLTASGVSIAFAAGSPAGPVPAAPLILPASAAVSSGTEAGTVCPRCSHWIVGGRPGPASERTATAHGGVAVAPQLGIYRTRRGNARRLVRALRAAGLLAYAEPDVALRPTAYPTGSLAGKQGWLGRIVNPTETTPPVAGPGSPLIGLIETGINPDHFALRGARLDGTFATGDFKTDSHGTAVAAIAGSPGGDSQIRGVWPGARMRQFAAGRDCGTASAAVIRAADARASVINMSYTFPTASCYSHYLALQYAVGLDVLPVAAAGNNALKGNPALGPGVYAHVISVAALDPADRVATFSTFNRGVEISAPGAGLFGPEVVAGGLGSDGSQLPKFVWTENLAGTSFAAPMVAAAAAWMRQQRPRMTGYQAGQLLTGSARDLGTPGRDPYYGSGILDIDAARIAPTPINDPLEPNDDIPLLKGESGLPRAQYLWKRGTTRLRATVSRAKDPADLYRIRIPARRRILIKAAQLEGSVAITALKPSTKTLKKIRGKVIVRSDRPFPKTEGIKVRNLRRKPADIWLAVTRGARGTADRSTYRLAIHRSR